MTHSKNLKSYRDLDVWKASMALVKSVYLLTTDFPKSEIYGLTSQIRRAAVSIPSNIAEGYGRVHRGDYVHHLSIAQASLCELETQLILGVDLGFSRRELAQKVWKDSQEVGKMLSKLIRSLNSRPPAPIP